MKRLVTLLACLTTGAFAGIGWLAMEYDSQAATPTGLVPEPGKFSAMGGAAESRIEIRSLTLGSQGATLVWSEAGPLASYALEFSTNLVRWTTVETFLRTNVCLASTGLTPGFFRIRLQYPPPMPAVVDRETVYQVATLTNLFQGGYDGIVSSQSLSRIGDVGIGTYEGLNGEMVFLDGVFYRVNALGQVEQIAGREGIPFACVTFLDSDALVVLLTIESLTALQQKLDELRMGLFPGATTNSSELCVVRITGTFSYVKTRSVPQQSKPYPPLEEVLASQPEFEFSNVAGTLIGFWFPDSASALNQPGWHLHFLKTDLTGGGHLLECRLIEAQAVFDSTPGYILFESESAPKE
jgi:acetolactate decarboxylase